MLIAKHIKYGKPQQVQFLLFKSSFQCNITSFPTITNDKNKTKFRNVNFAIFPEDQLRCSLARDAVFNESTDFIWKSEVAKIMPTENGKFSKGM